MSQPTFTISQNLFKASHPPINVRLLQDGAVDAAVLQNFLDTTTNGAIGVAAVYGKKCRLTSIAFASLSHVLVVYTTTHQVRGRNGGKPLPARRGRSLLQEKILCDARYHKYAFQMDRIAVALFQDLSLRIDGAVDMLSVSKADRRSLQALMNAMGGEVNLQRPNVKTLFFSGSQVPRSEGLALQAWAACRAASLPDMVQRFTRIPRINTGSIPNKHLAALATISRDADRLDALKPTVIKNEVKSDFTVKQNNLTLTSSRFPTRIRKSGTQHLLIETQGRESKNQVIGRALEVTGRQARIIVQGSLQGENIVSVTTVGKEDFNHAESSRENVILMALQGTTRLLSQPFFQSIWLPSESLVWPERNTENDEPVIHFPDRHLNSSQEKAVDKILSTSNQDKVVVIQGPPGTGKTTVIAAAVTSISHATPQRTIWIAAQSNVAVKNIAEKLVTVGFYDFKLLVSLEFHLDWHEHLYEQLQSRVIRSDQFDDAAVGASRLLLGTRVILCTLSMLSHPKIAVFVRLVPVETMIFDEASQIEAGDYVPTLHRFHLTLSKLVFIGDDKQLAPYGQEDVPELRSIFEFPHLRHKAIFLDIQYRVPHAIGGFISMKVYKERLRTVHSISDSKACRFIDVKNGREAQVGHSWMNRAEALIVMHIARIYVRQGKSFRIITPYDGQRSVIEGALKSANLPWENKVFNVDSFQGNEDDHIIVSVVRSEKIGFLQNERRTNVMLTRCKRSMLICSSRAFVTGRAASTLIGKLADSLGSTAWIDGKNVMRGNLA